MYLHQQPCFPVPNPQPADLHQQSLRLCLTVAVLQSHDGMALVSVQAVHAVAGALVIYCNGVVNLQSQRPAGVGLCSSHVCMGGDDAQWPGAAAAPGLARLSHSNYQILQLPLNNQAIAVGERAASG